MVNDWITLSRAQSGGAARTMAYSSLKTEELEGKLIPRSIERCLIEASSASTTLSAFVNSIPRSIERGLIEADGPRRWKI